MRIPPVCVSASSHRREFTKSTTMGCAGSCVRAVYSRAGPCVDRTNRIQPEKETLQELRSIRQSSSNAEQQQRVKEDAVYSFSGEYLWSDIDKSIPQSPKQPSSLSWCGSTVYCYVVSTFEDFHSVSLHAQLHPKLPQFFFRRREKFWRKK